MPAIGCRTAYASKVNVAGGGQHIDSVMPAFHVRTPVDSIKIHLKHLEHEAVGVVIVIAVFWGFSPKALPELFMAIEISFYGIHQFSERNSFLVINVMTDSRDHIRDAPYANPLYIIGIVPGSPGIVVLSLSMQSSVNKRQERNREVAGIQSFNDVVPPHLNVDEMPELGVEGIEQALYRFKTFRISGFSPYRFPALWINSVIQCYFKHFG